VAALFISDLHLDPQLPATVDACLRLLRGPAADYPALYILGDLFEYWIGDDAPAQALAPVLDALAALAARGTALTVMHGNRDFLLGDDFARRCGCRLVADDQLLECIGGVPSLLLHGDTLCTDDIDYQRFRASARDPAWQADFLARPLAERRAIVQGLRDKSRAAMRDKQAQIMDVNADAVAAAMREHGVRRLIHGHTHRPALHRFTLDGDAAERCVLGDWRADGAMLARCDENGALELFRWR